MDPKITSKMIHKPPSLNSSIKTCQSFKKIIYLLLLIGKLGLILFSILKVEEVVRFRSHEVVVLDMPASGAEQSTYFLNKKIVIWTEKGYEYKDLILQKFWP